MADPAIIEDAARVLFASEMPGSDWEVFPGLHDKYRSKATNVLRLAEIVLTSATPLIRAQAIEDAAKVAEGFSADALPSARKIAAAVRALKKQP